MGRYTMATSAPTKVAPPPSARSYHPVKLGEVLADRYEVINQLGSGVYSNVLLVRDLRYGFVLIHYIVFTHTLLERTASLL